jgi:1,4-alpha-glucan branching enzyme
MIAFEKDKLLFVFNFHYTKSFVDYRLGCKFAGKLKVVLDTDALEFGGLGRIDHSVLHHTDPLGHNNRPNFVQVYIPSRTAIVLSPVE